MILIVGVIGLIINLVGLGLFHGECCTSVYTFTALLAQSLYFSLQFFVAEDKYTGHFISDIDTVCCNVLVFDSFPSTVT